MSIFARLLSSFSTTYRAKWLYQRGMSSAKSHQHEAAIDDYTAVINMAKAPPPVRAMALYNRALVYRAQRKDAEAVDDLEQLLRMPAAGERVQTEARRQLLRMKRADDRGAGSVPGQPTDGSGD